MVVILMGVTGAGKTTVGRALAEQLHWTFADADDYHSAANIAKMRAGISLTDRDRVPWLASLRTAINGWLTAGENVVLACSALKSAYRHVLLRSPEVKLVYLRADRKLIAERLAERAESLHESATHRQPVRDPGGARGGREDRCRAPYAGRRT